MTTLLSLSENEKVRFGIWGEALGSGVGPEKEKVRFRSVAVGAAVSAPLLLEVTVALPNRCFVLMGSFDEKMGPKAVHGSSGSFERPPFLFTIVEETGFGVEQIGFSAEPTDPFQFFFVLAVLVVEDDEEEEEEEVEDDLFDISSTKNSYNYIFCLCMEFSLSLSLSFYLSIFLSIYLSIYISIYLCLPFPLPDFGIVVDG